MAHSTSLLAPGEFTPGDVTFGVKNGHIVVANSSGRTCDLGTRVSRILDGETIEVTAEDLLAHLNSDEYHEELMGAAVADDPLRFF